MIRYLPGVASAGGMERSILFFDHAPFRIGVFLCGVQHLSSDFKKRDG
jgi:hypothetical protein